ncbi:hypothetical protein GALMADRAFT_1365977, partial [Galerina marginata CBS 339.88]
RKLDDAFHVLDNAVTPSPVPDGPPPPKRSNTIRSSLYSTLAKYGIKSSNHPYVSNLAYCKKSPQSVSSIPNAKSTPHLTAILSRAASRTKNTFSFRFPSQSHTPAPPLPANAEYRPSSLSSFLLRLATYKLTTYANKPPAVDAVAASKCGWINDGKDRLVCGLCNASWVVGGREGLNRDAANTLIEKQRISLVEGHKLGCPWRTRQCDDSIYCIPLHSPVTMIRDIKVNATTMDSMIKDVLIKHPLTASQLNALHSTFTSYSYPLPTRTAEAQSPTPSPVMTEEPSETAILASLFGWTLVSPAPPQTRRVSTTRANSVASSVPPSPPLSRASSVSLPQTPAKLTSQSTEIPFRLPSNLGAKPENTLLQCELCQRRIGLWTFSARPPDDEPDTSMTQSSEGDVPNSPAPRPKKPLPRRAFDLLKEHRSYCPYVVRSTVIPSLPVPQTPATPGRSSGSNGHASSSSLSYFNGRNGVPSALEGWRAVLTIVLRYGMAQKQRVEYNFLAPKDPAAQEGEQDSDSMEVDNVKAMVTGVKARGGKDLLKYVRGLLS